MRSGANYASGEAICKRIQNGNPALVELIWRRLWRSREPQIPHCVGGDNGGACRVIGKPSAHE